MFKKYMDKTDGAIRGFDVKSPRIKILCIFIVAVCIIFSVVALFPAIWVFLSGFKDMKELFSSEAILPNEWSFDGFKETWDKLKFAQYYMNSFIVVVGAVVCSVVFNGLTAYGLVVLKPKGSKVIDALIMWSMLIPSTTTVVALFVNLKNLGLTGTYIPLWLCFGANAFYVILFKEFFENIPKEVIEAAKIDGCNSLKMFYKIILPLSRPIIMVVLIFTATAAWSDFLLPFLLLNGSNGKETVMVKLYQYSTSTTTAIDMVRAIFFSIIPPTVIFAIFQKKIMDGAAGGAVKG